MNSAKSAALYDPSTMDANRKPSRERAGSIENLHANPMSRTEVNKAADDAPFASYKEGFTNCALPLDRPCASPVGGSPITRAFVNEDELVREVRKRHMLTKFLALELVALNCDLRQLQAAISKRSIGGTFHSLSSWCIQIFEERAIRSNLIPSCPKPPPSPSATHRGRHRTLL